MARLPRINRPGAWYHVTARGNEGKPIYRDQRDPEHFLDLLARWRERFRLRLHAYVLMPNHYHLLLQTAEANLSRAMQWLNVSYTVWCNRRHQRVGHVLQGRYKAVIVNAEDWALGLSRYIHLNPVRIKGWNWIRRRSGTAGNGRAKRRLRSWCASAWHCSRLTVGVRIVLSPATKSRRSGWTVSPCWPWVEANRRNGKSITERIAKQR